MQRLARQTIKRAKSPKSKQQSRPPARNPSQMNQIDSNQTTKITLIKTHIQKALFQSLSVEAKQKT